MVRFAPRPLSKEKDVMLETQAEKVQASNAAQLLPTRPRNVWVAYEAARDLAIRWAGRAPIDTCIQEV